MMFFLELSSVFAGLAGALFDNLPVWGNGTQAKLTKGWGDKDSRLLKRKHTAREPLPRRENVPRNLLGLEPRCHRPLLESRFKST
jgi:hypothetical protein